MATKMSLSFCVAGVVLATAAGGEVWEVGNVVPRASVAQAGAHFGAALALGDFDDDGDLDLAVGEPDRDGASGSPVDTGAVHLFRNEGHRLFGSWSPLYGNGGGFLGSALAAGDFDGDGRAELAMGLPGLPYNLVDAAGRIGIYEMVGSSWQSGPPVFQCGDLDPGAEVGDQFGSVLAVGDFDDDGIDDLAVGVPDEDYDGHSSAGKVCVYYRPGGPGPWSQELIVDAESLDGTITTVDQAGFALAVGDFNGNGVDDLAIGAPGRDLSGQDNAGVIHVVHGLDGSGLTLVGQAVMSYANFGGTVAEYDRFGAALAAADFDSTSTLWCALHDCYDDLAIGVPGDDVTLGLSYQGAGRVVVSYGSSTGLDPSGTTWLSQILLSEIPATSDQFGATLAAGPVRKGSLPADLVVGVPGENTAGASDGGYIHVVFGSSTGLAQVSPYDQGIELRSNFLAGPANSGDRWGEVLAIGDLDGDGYGDLVVGIPSKIVNGQADAGVVQIIWGSLFADGFGLGDLSAW